ncbi:MAG: tetratricopeptide repeat protein, partial [Dokdonella sp.]
QGRTDASLALSRSNFKEARTQLGDRDPITLYAGHELLQNLIVEGELAPARELVDTLIDAVPSAEAGLLSRMLRDSARIATLEKNQARALTDGAEALRIARAAHDEGELSSTLFEFGNMQLSTDDVAGAIATFEETLALRTRFLGARHVNVAAVDTALSRAYRRRGETDRAVASARAALDITRAALPPDHYRLGFQYNALAIALVAQREFVEARKAAAESLRINRAAFGEANVETIGALSWVGRIDLLNGEDSKAIDELRDALKRSVARVGAAHADTLSIQASLGVALAGSSALVEGIRELRAATAGFAALAKADSARQALAIEALARIELESGDTTAALSSVDQLDTTLAAVRIPDAYWNGRAAALRALVLQREGRAEESIKQYEVAKAELASSSTPDPLLQAEVAIGQAELSRESIEATAGERIAVALKSFDALRAPPSALTARAQRLRD